MQYCGAKGGIVYVYLWAGVGKEHLTVLRTKLCTFVICHFLNHYNFFIFDTFFCPCGVRVSDTIWG